MTVSLLSKTIVPDSEDICKDNPKEFLMSEGIPAEPDVMKPESTTVFSFPMASPRGAITRTILSAIEQLELWLTYQRYWSEHKPSVTISVNVCTGRR